MTSNLSIPEQGSIHLKLCWLFSVVHDSEAVHHFEPENKRVLHGRESSTYVGFPSFLFSLCFRRSKNVYYSSKTQKAGVIHHITICNELKTCARTPQSTHAHWQLLHYHQMDELVIWYNDTLLYISFCCREIAYNTYCPCNPTCFHPEMLICNAPIPDRASRVCQVMTSNAYPGNKSNWRLRIWQN